MSSTILEGVLYSGLINFIFWFFIFIFSIFYIRIPLYHPFFLYLIYHFLGYILRPFLIYINQNSFLWDRIGIYPQGFDIFTVTIVANIALLSVFSGLIIGMGGVSKLKKPKKFHVIIGRDFNFYIALFVLVTLGLYANYISIADAGLDSVLAYESERDEKGGGRLVGVSGYVTALAEFLPPICILLFMIPKIRKIAFLLIIAYILLRFFAGAQRLSFVIVVAGAYSYYLIIKNKSYPNLNHILILLVFAFIFDVIGSDRYAARKLMMGETTISEILVAHNDSRGSNALTSDIVEYDVATATLTVVNNYDTYTYGSQYLRILIWPIPRQIWNDKPVYTSIVNLNDYGDFRYLTTGVYADSYMAFSYASLIFLMALLGYFFSRIYNALLYTESVAYMLFYWVVFIFTKTILRDGGVTFIYFWVFSMIPVFILCYMGKLRLVRSNND